MPLKKKTTKKVKTEFAEWLVKSKMNWKLGVAAASLIQSLGFEVQFGKGTLGTRSARVSPEVREARKVRASG